MHCGHFDGDDRYTLGNAVTDDFADILHSETFRERVAENDAELEALPACPSSPCATAGAPHDRYLSARHNPAHRRDCCALADLIGHIRSRLDDVAAMGGLPTAPTVGARLPSPLPRPREPARRCAGLLPLRSGARRGSPSARLATTTR